ncbi:hypothetical protein PR202_gb01413 [Eleusine coracana subsp. coracana]|uniref:Major facilitator superfamily (MFS) profile domain-containing protein n=1 Tax=Eleusine coracana subsp. coracana TaxID=191504 RepID=A0AAV5DW19_ELECO|nr:hypothetical protein PR202_gb01413 [Eleusine coracana subsp. coracana]
MASVRSCLSVKPGASPVKYRSTRLGWAAPGAPGRLSIQPASSSSSAFSGDGRTDTARASSSSGFLGDGGRITIMRGGRRVVAMCSASLDAVGPPPAAAAAVAPVAASAFPERTKVVALVAAVMLICNAHRVVMSVAVVPLAAQYGWSSAFLGIVQSSFLWGYVFSSMVGGALADRYGGKKVMAGAAALWWFPTQERATAVGISMGGFHLGNVVSFLSTPIIMSHIGLTGTFAFFASLGYLWLAVWLFNVESDPLDSHTISKSELQYIVSGRSASKLQGNKFPTLKELLSKMQFWAIIVANVVNNWGYFVLLSWMPVYFKTVYNVNLKQAAWFSAIPWAVMAMSGYVAGASADFLIKSGFSIALVRKIMQSIGFIGPGVSLLCLKFAQTPSVAAVLMTLALSLSSFSQAGYFCNVQDIAPKYAGSLHGLTNGIGTVAAIVSTIGTGYFVQWLGSFQAFLTLTAGLYFSATIFYNTYATGDLVFD